MSSLSFNKYEKKLLNKIENVFGTFENVFDENMFKFNSYKSSFEKKITKLFINQTILNHEKK